VSVDYVLAGYRVAALGERQDWREVGLSSADVLSMSTCVADLVLADWDYWFISLVAAELARVDNPGTRVLAVGVAVDDVVPLVGDIDGDMAAGDLPDRLMRHEPLPAGKRLGFELVGMDDGGPWHTWTCLGGLVADVREATGVRPGEWGLIQDEQDARRAARWLTDSGLGDPKVFFWVPALLMEMP
jgi:hypothetical protein